MEVSPSRRFEKTLIFPMCKHSRTLLIVKPVNCSHPSYDATYENQAFSHPNTQATYELPFYKVFTQENKTSFLRKSSSPFSLQELRPLTPLKATYRFTSLMVIGMMKIMCNTHPPLFISIVIMAHVRSQDLEAHFNTLQYNFIETQQEVRQLSANISTINKTMHSSIAASIEELKADLKQDITTQLEFFTLMICTKMHISIDPPLSEPPLHTEAETFSHSHNF
jgi:hypothetical protein